MNNLSSIAARAIVAVFCSVALIESAQAVPFTMVAERSHEFVSLGNEIYTLTYDSLDDFNNANSSSVVLTSQSLATSFSLGGFEYDGNQYHAVVERDRDFISFGNDIYLLSYDSLDDFNNGSIASNQLTGLSLATSFSVGGFAYDGSQYHLLAERDYENVALGNELYLLSYNSIADFVSGIAASSILTAQSLATSFDAAGFTYDGNQFHMLAERRSEFVSFGNEIYTLSYDSLADFIGANSASTVLTSQSLATSFDVGGFSAMVEKPLPPVSVPEPPSWALLAAALLAMTRLLRPRAA
jgi:hypothetical protein